jgi:hypothetical protein
LKQSVLVLTNSRDETADFLTTKLQQVDLPFVRLNTDELQNSLRLSATEYDSYFVVRGREYAPESFAHVWLRRPQPFTLQLSSDPAENLHIQREWAAAVEGWLARIPPPRWINHPAANVSASYKIEQLFRAKRTGLCVPDTLVTQSFEEAKRFYDAHGGGIVVKPITGGYIEREDSHADTVIYTQVVSSEKLSLFPAGIACPTLLQQRIRKKCDVRVTVLDEDLHAVALTAIGTSAGQPLDVRQNNFIDIHHEPIKLPDVVESRIRDYVRSYGLRFAALDMAVDDRDAWVFFELNPNGEWAWLDLAGAADIARSFIKTFRQ